MKAYVLDFGDITFTERSMQSLYEQGLVPPSCGAQTSGQTMAVYRRRRADATAGLRVPRPRAISSYYMYY